VELPRRILRISGVIYLLCAGATIGLLAAIATHYTPYDASSIVFVHFRLPHAELLTRIFLLLAFLWFAAYLVVVTLTWRLSIRATRIRTVVLLSIQTLVGIAFVLVPTAIDSDQYAYIGYAYALDGANPYVNPRLPVAVSQARDVGHHWGDPLPPDRYGPGWTLLNASVLRPFSTQPLILQAIVLRCLALLAALAVTALLLFSRIGSFGASAAFALNPLVLIETANGAHNDIYLVFFGMSAIVLVAEKRYLLASVALGLAVAMKFAYAPFIAPLLAVVYERSRSWTLLLGSACAFAAVVVLTAAPFGYSAVLVAATGAQHLMGGVTGLAIYLLRHFPFVAPHALAVVDGTVIVALLGCILALTLDAHYQRVVPNVVLLTAILLIVSVGKMEAWYAIVTAPMLAVPSTSTRVGWLAVTSFGLTLVTASFTGHYLILQALAVCIVVVITSAGMLVVRWGRPVPAG
jgi:hypothetical protein